MRTNKHFRPYKLVLSGAIFLLFGFLFGCTGKDTSPMQFSEKLHVSWELVENQMGNGSSSRVAFTFHNLGKVSIGPTGWAMYWNQKTIFPMDLNDAEIGSVEHLNGDFYRFVPGPEFSLNPGETLRFEYGYNDIMIKDADAPIGLYLVFGEGEKEPVLVPVNNFSLVPYAQSERTFPDPEIAATLPNPNREFHKNSKILPYEPEIAHWIMPTPVNIKPVGGNVALTSSTEIYYDEALAGEAAYLAHALSNLGSLNTKPMPLSAPVGPGTILLQLKPISVKGVEKEAYHLAIGEGAGVKISGSDPSGVFYGIQSLLQLIDPLQLAQNKQEYVLPGVEIYDAPRFHFRGFLLDVSRNFQTKDAVLKLIDLLALYKVNHLNFRLTEDEGWRLEIDGLPELTTVGARRGHTITSESFLHPAFGSGPFPDATGNHGTGFYSREDFKEIVRYAAQRHITIVPEICFPSHARAAIMAMEARYRHFMELGNEAAAEEFRLIDPDDTSEYYSAQIFTDNIVSVARESTYHFYETVVADLMAMFREAGVELTYLHTGGDEVPAGAWTKSPMAQKLLAEQPEIGGVGRLQNHFLKKMMQRLEPYNLTFGGWEETVLQRDEAGKVSIATDLTGGGLIPYVWDNTGNNIDLGYRIANAGYPVVLCNVTNLYFDLAYNTDPQEPGLYWGGFQDAIDPFLLVPYDVYKSTIYSDLGVFSESSHPYPGKERLKPENYANIIGIQAQLWTETVRGEAMMHYYILPKLFAFAEKVWSQPMEWENESDSGERIRKIESEWSLFANRIGQRELIRLDAYRGGYHFRIPLPGAVLEDGILKANLSFPGFEIRYTTDGSEPSLNSPVYTEPVRVDGQVQVRAFTPGGRGGRSWVVN